MELTGDLAVAPKGIFPYTTDDVAKYINHPKITGLITLRKFLRKEGLMRGDYPTALAIENGYMKIQRCWAHNLQKWYDKIMISPAGLEFIEKLVEEKLGPITPVKTITFNNLNFSSNDK
ncbi:hypothetical protein [Dyadobacter sp. CY312]|uniref:hypothetical protein n=1 Tax=Dyadobacter sp. CY312 TaxID=2907303 RepID=UPI001F455440|nr:hypothetical protein [Dyadobacter sp. CY312]MCE7043958.1 hypothetical protein [Dyadobacter sp. CY312]